MSYNRWRNGTPSRTYKAVWLPSQKHELYHYGVKGMRWGQHLKKAAQYVSDVTGYGAYKEYKQASMDADKAWNHYQATGGYDSAHAGDDEAKKARQEWETADFFKKEAYKKYKDTPIYKAQQKIEKGKQLVRDIMAAFKKFRG